MKRINWYEPRFGEEENKIILEVLKENYVNEGPKTREFEKKIEDYLGVKHAIMTTNATAGLFLAVKADAEIKKKKKFEVIVPDLTMIATATAVELAGGTPRIIDVNSTDGTMNMKDIEDRITEDTIGIMPVHVLGRAVDMTRLEKIAKRNDLTIIEDAAGALGSKDIYGRYLGTIGDVGVYSLQSNKIITSGQGGVIVTNNGEYFEKIRRLRDFGRLSNKEFLHQEAGYNFKFNDLSAALALGQFTKLEDRKKMLLEQRAQYFSELNKIKEISFFPLKNGEIPLWIDVITENRMGLVKHLKENEIYPRECWPALHMNPPYKNQGNNNTFPVASNISDNALWLPNGPALTREDISYVAEKIKEFYKQ